MEGEQEAPLREAKEARAATAASELEARLQAASLGNDAKMASASAEAAAELARRVRMARHEAETEAGTRRREAEAEHQLELTTKLAAQVHLTAY